MADKVTDEKKRESGEPGGGQGRRDETGKSGVYPASGPDAPGDAVIRHPAGWGQGERGAEGYQDHGDSETPLIREEGDVPGFAPTKPEKKTSPYRK